MSDTKKELQRDTWIKDHQGMCGTCKYCQPYKFVPVYLCVNQKSENSNDFVDVEDYCNKYESLHPLF